MTIDAELLERLERLAMIELSHDEAQVVTSNLNEILGFIQNIASVDTDAITQESSARTPLRDDVPRQSAVAQSVLENAPKAQDGFFIVPKIIE